MDEKSAEETPAVTPPPEVEAPAAPAETTPPPEVEAPAAPSMTQARRSGS